MDYTVIASTNNDEFISEVGKLLSKGWIPQGGVSVRTLGRYETELAQAMIKKDSNGKGGFIFISKDRYAEIIAGYEAWQNHE